MFTATTLLTQKGVSLHVTDQSGYLPLHYAVSNGHVELVRLLLEMGVDGSCYLSGIPPPLIPFSGSIALLCAVLCCAMLSLFLRPQ